ncbi:MAG: hypothetical protein K5793_05925 [Nitrosarchaeum sp.]|nr:hypothetical protein [Nitrosarchaeum sp.]
MRGLLVVFAISALMIIPIGHAFSQEMGLATFQEIAQVIVDKSISQNVTASITLQSTSIQEIKIPAELEERIREDGRISSITVTNQDQCILGVHNESCIMINVKREPADKNFLQIQNTTLRVAEQFIDEINQVFDTDAELHSTFIHTDDQSRIALDTSGVISGKGTVSAVYTMPMEDTSSMYEKTAAILIPKVIRDSGGFYEVARDLSTQENAKMTFSIIPTEDKSLLQLRLSVDYPQTAASVDKISPLEFLKTDELKRSEYFSAGFYPLNSLLQVVVLSPEETNVSDVRGGIVPTQLVGDERIPTEVTKPGWVFDPEQGIRIQGKYIFGDTTSVKSDRLGFSLGGSQLEAPKTTENAFDESIIIVIIIAVVAIAAAAFYLKGYRK